MKIDRFFMSFLLTQRILSFGSGGKTECEWIQLLSSMSVERSQSSNNERRSLRRSLSRKPQYSVTSILTSCQNIVLSLWKSVLRN